MSTTVSYKGNTLTTVSNQTKTLDTAGTWMEDDLVLTDLSSGGGGGLTQHVIHLEFDDTTDADIEVDYDNALIGTMITAYAPSAWTYNNKSVVLAQLDGNTWYSYTPIPLNTELVDYTKVKNDYTVSDATGEEESTPDSCVSDYMLIDPSMTFNYVGYRWYTICFYTSAKVFISGLWMESDTGDLDGDYKHGTLSGAKIPQSAAYVRISSYPTNPTSSTLSLIRTA